MGWGRGVVPQLPSLLLLGFRGGAWERCAGAGRAAALTCLPDEDLVWGAGGPLARSVVHTHAYFVAPVLVQVWG